MNEDAHASNQPLDFDPATLPEDVRALPEPARQTAIDTIQRMLESGASRDEAIEKGRAMASDWISQRAPGDQSAVKIEDAAVPDREEIDPTESRITTKLRVGGARQR
jgi:uncharacterized protein YdaT